MQFKGKLMNETWKNGKKTNFGPDIGPNMVLKKNFYKLLWNVISRKIKEPNLRTWLKT